MDSRNTSKLLLLITTLVASVAFFAVITWPLPRYFGEGIPANAKKGHVREMISGDHLQLLYHFWLARDMMAFETPWFNNLYEFNQGRDEDRYKPTALFMPFPLFYAVGEIVGGKAFGYNLAIIITIWGTMVFTWLLTRRFSSRFEFTLLGTMVGLMIPVWWVYLMGGSPAGFAMMWIPALWLGLDMAFRSEKMSGAFLAGIALLGLSFCDSHGFFFGCLLAPFWCVLSLAMRESLKWRSSDTYVRLFKTLIPLMVIVVVVVLYSIMRHSHLSDSVLGSAGRPWKEIVLFSPKLLGLIHHGTEGVTSHIYLGWPLFILFFAGWVACLTNLVRKHEHALRNAILFTLILTVIGVTINLALGVNGPWDGRLLILARKIIGPYALVRQPAKIYCVLPVLCAVGSVVAIQALARLSVNRVWSYGTVILVFVWVGFDLKRETSPTISLLDREQAAYEAVAQDAVSEQKEARALIIPLWPGDSDDTSACQHFASLYRIRMINGYSPTVRADYYENVFLKFKSVNQGGITDEQCDDLMEMGIRYVLLHEDAFPWKVSPFPVYGTLRNLLNHPRLEFLDQDKSVWAFRLRAEPGPSILESPDWNFYFPSRRWEVERLKYQKGVNIVKAEEAGGGGYVTLKETNAWVQVSFANLVDAPQLRWAIRVRGRGTVLAKQVRALNTTSLSVVEVDQNEWSWKSIPIMKDPWHGQVAVQIEHNEGSVDLDIIQLEAGRSMNMQPGETMVLPALVFFHAGYSILEDQVVQLTRDRDREGVVFYGPKLPLEKGTYTFELVFQTDAADGTELGAMNLRPHEKYEEDWIPVKAGQPATGTFESTYNLPMFLGFKYNRNADMTISEVLVTRQP